jgi:hypothetical protein
MSVVPQEVTEASSTSRFDRFHDFWQIATPKIFEWFGWVAALGALSYINNKHPSLSLLALILLGYLSLIFYFGGFFIRHPVAIPGIRSKRAREFVWEFVAILLGYGANRLVQHAVLVLSQGGP